jgi:hypothetical protein
MTPKRLEALNAMAVEVTKEFVNGNGAIESRYMSAAASFAIDIVRLGAASATLSYLNRAGIAEHYPLIPKAVLSIANGENLTGMDDKTVYECIYAKRNDMKFIKKLQEAAAALKFEMRMYEKIDNEGGDDA